MQSRRSTRPAISRRRASRLRWLRDLSRGALGLRKRREPSDRIIAPWTGNRCCGHVEVTHPRARMSGRTRCSCCEPRAGLIQTDELLLEEKPMPGRVAGRLSADRLRELAQAGAEVALRRLRAEIIAIERTFPELALPRRRRALRQSLKQASNRTHRASAAARKAVSDRMKRYWAERRKARTKVK